MSDVSNNNVLSNSNWFSERNDFWPGSCFSIEIDKVLHKETSQYQEVLIFESKTFGKVLVLDGIIQCTEKDEFSYQEMIAHLPMFSHPNPKSVLIVGGGDGGVVREVLKHPGVEEVHLCEIDERVIELSKLYFPTMSSGFGSSKLTIHVKDGVKFLKDHINKFDVIITDSPDPIGPAVPLFERPYYEKTKAALKKGGILCCQGECIWLNLDFVSKALSNCRSTYPSVSYAYTTIPTYPGGQIGFILACKDKDFVFKEPTREMTEKEMTEMDLKYYTPSMHRASFVLPRFAQDVLKF